MPGQDFIAFMDALSILEAILAGYDWGGWAACVAAALQPEHIAGLVSATATTSKTGPPRPSRNRPLGSIASVINTTCTTRAAGLGLRQTVPGFAAPSGDSGPRNGGFDDATFAGSASSSTNPDFVDVVVHSYRYRFSLVAGDPAAVKDASRLASMPPIQAPTVVIHGASDQVTPPEPSLRQRAASQAATLEQCSPA